MLRLGRYKKLFTIDGQEAQRFACRPQEGQRPKRREYRLSGFSPPFCLPMVCVSSISDSFGLSWKESARDSPGQVKKERGFLCITNFFPLALLRYTDMV